MAMIRRMRRVLGQTEETMRKALMRSSESNCSLRWSYSSGSDLVGKKIEDPFSGDTRIVFDVVSKRRRR